MSAHLATKIPSWWRTLLTILVHPVVSLQTLAILRGLSEESRKRIASLGLTTERGEVVVVAQLIPGKSTPRPTDE